MNLFPRAKSPLSVFLCVQFPCYMEAFSFMTNGRRFREKLTHPVSMN